MATEFQGNDRRKEVRYPLEAQVIVRAAGGRAIHATAVDISSSGMRLRFPEPCALVEGEEITVEVELPEHPDKSFSAWGVGRIAYIDAQGAGIQLLGGEFETRGPSDTTTQGELG
jgi:hypothetical protein